MYDDSGIAVVIVLLSAMLSVIIGIFAWALFELDPLFAIQITLWTWWLIVAIMSLAMEASW